MSISKQYVSEKFVEGYVKTPPSLLDQTITKFAVHLCKHVQLKKYITRDKYSYTYDRLEHLIREESYALCERLELPPRLKAPIIPRIWLTAVRLLDWQLEYFLMLSMSPPAADKLLTPSSWTAEGRINEINLAEQVLRDERIPVYKRYNLACVLCLEPFIRTLWSEVRSELKKELLNDQSNVIFPHSYLIRLWSCYIEGKFSGHMDHIWQRGLETSAREGQRSGVICCWNKLSKSAKNDVIVNVAFITLTGYNNGQVFRKRPIRMPSSDHPILRFLLDISPIHYCDILFFLLSQMSDEQIVQFFLQAFDSNQPHEALKYDSKFDWMLESPYQDYCIPIITKLWGILPEAMYGELLLTISCRYENKDNKKMYEDYDYGRLMIELVKTTPENYRRYICNTVMDKTDLSLSRIILRRVLNKEPSDRRKAEIVQKIFHWETVEVRRNILFWKSSFNSPSFLEDLCKSLIETRELGVLDDMLKDCFQENVIKDFTIKFMSPAKRPKICS